MSIRCGSCRAENEPTEKFCDECGSPLSVVSVPASETSSVPAPEVVGELVKERETLGERRHLTILFCDLVNSTTLAAQLDPEEWRATVAS
jgi:class 3 adenylate cyclase